jgi:hypothetical protein
MNEIKLPCPICSQEKPPSAPPPRIEMAEDVGVHWILAVFAVAFAFIFGFMGTLWLISQFL